MLLLSPRTEDKDPLTGFHGYQYLINKELVSWSPLITCSTSVKCKCQFIFTFLSRACPQHRHLVTHLCSCFLRFMESQYVGEGGAKAVKEEMTEVHYIHVGICQNETHLSV